MRIKIVCFPFLSRQGGTGRTCQPYIRGRRGYLSLPCMSFLGRVFRNAPQIVHISSIFSSSPVFLSFSLYLKHATNPTPFLVSPRSHLLNRAIKHALYLTHVTPRQTLTLSYLLVIDVFLPGGPGRVSRCSPTLRTTRGRMESSAIPLIGSSGPALLSRTTQTTSHI